MKTFKHPNLKNNWVCPICDKNTDKPITLVPIHGSEQDNIIETEQIHFDCITQLEFMYNKEYKILIAKI